ncbi:MAG: ABC transporter ATP-binding protein [Candidatus Kryptoniota bacterium]
MKLVGENLKKVFNRRIVFENISFVVESGQSLSITGPNGSGKSTISKIICGLLSATAGKIEYQDGTEKIPREDFHKHIGFVAPYLELYGEFTALENLIIEGKARGLRNVEEKASEILMQVGLFNRRNDEVRGFSSGMKQRMKYASALIHDPQILLLDEPMANLDEAGMKMVLDLIDTFKKDKILIVATNDPAEAEIGNIRIKLQKSLGDPDGK